MLSGEPLVRCRAGPAALQLPPRVTAQHQFPPLPQMPRAARLPGWPRLMGEQMAADYLSIGTTMLREAGPAGKKLRGRTVWDIHDLDRFADALAGQPLDESDAGAHSRDVERRWLESRGKRKGQGNG